MFEGERGKALQADLQEFLKRPENRPLVEKQQRKEVKQALKIKERIHGLEFRQTFLSADSEAKQNMAPFLQNRVLRRIVMCLANDAEGDFEKWANNPKVIAMFRDAKRLLDEKRVSEDEIEHVLLRQLNDPHNPHHEEFKEKTKQVVRLPTDQLVGALNEHLAERRQGNEAYRKRELCRAMGHYQRALAVVNFVEAANPVDQAEICANKVAVLLNMAAVYIEQENYGGAVALCSEVLGLEADNTKALMRRAKAYAGRHEYGSAERDLNRVLELDPWNFDVHDEMERVKRTRRKAQEKEKAVFKSIFDSPGL